MDFKKISKVVKKHTHIKATWLSCIENVKFLFFPCVNRQVHFIVLSTKKNYLPDLHSWNQQSFGQIYSTKLCTVCTGSVQGIRRHHVIIHSIASAWFQLQKSMWTLISKWAKLWYYSNKHSVHILFCSWGQGETILLILSWCCRIPCILTRCIQWM